MKERMKAIGKILWVALVIVFLCAGVSSVTGCKGLGGGGGNVDNFRCERSPERSVGQSESRQHDDEAHKSVIVDIWDSSVLVVFSEREDESGRDRDKPGGSRDSHDFSRNSFIFLREDDCSDPIDPNSISDSLSGCHTIYSWRICDDPNTLDAKACIGKDREEVSKIEKQKQFILGFSVGSVVVTILYLLHRVNTRTVKNE